MKMLVRRLGPAEWRGAYPIVAQLRHLDEEEFIRRVDRQSYSGYELVGAFRDGELVGAMGMRPVQTLARGPYVHVDDLVVDAAVRGSGKGAPSWTLPRPMPALAGWAPSSSKRGRRRSPSTRRCPLPSTPRRR